MRELLKSLLRKTPFFHPLRDRVIARRWARETREWEEKGRPAPPPHPVKEQTLRGFAQRYGLKVLVETGTYRGDMVAALKDDFDRIYSVEVSGELHAYAAERFKRCKHITLVHGDSGAVIRDILAHLNQPALFWLDSHYSGAETAKGEKETPIYQELSHIFQAPDEGHVIVIDDARCFGADPAYPTIDELIGFVRSHRPDASVSVENDSIRITPGLKWSASR